MRAFAGFLSSNENVAPAVEAYLKAVPGEARIYSGYVMPDGRAGAMAAPARRLAHLLPDVRAVLISRQGVCDTLWDASPVFGAIDPAPANADVDACAYALDGALVARITSVFLQRGVAIEPALERTLAKFPTPVSALLLASEGRTPTLIAKRGGAPIWLSEKGRCRALFSGAAAPDYWPSRHGPIEQGDIVILAAERTSIIDAEGMRMDKHSARETMQLALS